MSLERGALTLIWAHYSQFSFYINILGSRPASFTNTPNFSYVAILCVCVWRVAGGRSFGKIPGENMGMRVEEGEKVKIDTEPILSQ